MEMKVSDAPEKLADYDGSDPFLPIRSLFSELQIKRIHNFHDDIQTVGT